MQQRRHPLPICAQWNTRGAQMQPHKQEKDNSIILQTILHSKLDNLSIIEQFPERHVLSKFTQE